METHNIPEPFIEERIAHIQDTARQLIAGKYKTQQELEHVIRVNISHHYQMPFHSDFFNNLTFDDLLLEWFLIKERVPQSAEDVSKEIATKYADELQQISKDIPGQASAVAEDDKQWEPLSEDEMAIMTNFMKTNKFVGEK